MTSYRRRKKVISLLNYRSRRYFLKVAKDLAQSLPAPSKRFDSLVFVYDEQLAITGKQLLFAKLNELAKKNGQILVITDVSHDWAGLYVNFDEIGEGLVEDPGYDDLIDSWSASTR